jgi:hypothetical protein
MYVSTLRVARNLPETFEKAVASGAGFRMVIDGKTFSCRSLTEAQSHTRTFDESQPVELLNTPA